MRYFADSYALVEYVKGNYHYVQYIEGGDVITTRLNLMELYYSVLKEAGKDLAEKYYAVLLPFAVEFSDSELKNAMHFRLRMQKEKRNVSYVDALGYTMAISRKMQFLTGDKEFRGMKNVEFVK